MLMNMTEPKEYKNYDCYYLFLILDQRSVSLESQLLLISCVYSHPQTDNDCSLGVSYFLFDTPCNA